MQTGVSGEKKAWADGQRDKPLKPIEPYVQAILATVPEGERQRVQEHIGWLCHLMYCRGWYGV